jgi:competence protein ComGC
LSRPFELKTRFSNQANHALTFIEVLVVVTVLCVAAAMFLPIFTANQRRARSMGCENNLRQIGVDFQRWSNDHQGKFPMELSAAQGGTRESVVTGDALPTFQCMSNYWNTPKILICPADKMHAAATNLSMGFSGANISYFVGVDAATNYPQAFLSGDDDFVVNGVAVKPGLVEFSTNGVADPWKMGIDYSDSRHFQSGSFVFADGSLRHSTDTYLASHLSETGFVTNRLAIP